MKTIVNCSAIVDTQLCSSRELKGNEAELPSLSWESLIWIPRVWFWWNTSAHTSISALYLSCIVQHGIKSFQSHRQEFAITPKMIIPSNLITRHYNNHTATNEMEARNAYAHIQMDSDHNHSNTKQHTGSPGRRPYHNEQCSIEQQADQVHLYSWGCIDTRLIAWSCDLWPWRSRPVFPPPRTWILPHGPPLGSPGFSVPVWRFERWWSVFHPRGPPPPTPDASNTDL